MSDLKKQFSKDVALHVLEVVRDDDFFRHLKFFAPGKGAIDFFTITVWPGRLCFTGDRGTYVFALRGNSSGDVNYWTKRLEAYDLHCGYRKFSTYDGTEFSYHYLWCLEAIAWGMKKYEEMRECKNERSGKRPLRRDTNDFERNSGGIILKYVNFGNSINEMIKLNDKVDLILHEVCHGNASLDKKSEAVSGFKSLQDLLDRGPGVLAREIEKLEITLDKLREVLT